jgi:hypothetical protein
MWPAITLPGTTGAACCGTPEWVAPPRRPGQFAQLPGWQTQDSTE